MKFRLLRGSHNVMEWKPASKEEVESEVPDIVHRANGKAYRLHSRTYEAGEEIESERDLAKEFNCPGPLGPRFMKIEQMVPAGSASHMGNPWDNLETMNEKQLKAFALSQEIDLGGAKTQSDVLALLLSYRDGEESPSSATESPAE